MSLLVYGVSEGGLELLGAHGLDDRPLMGIETDGLMMVVTEHQGPPVAVTEANLRRYEEVVEGLMERQEVLPARFGTTLAEADQSLRVLRERREELEAGLAGVRGAVELAVQGRWREGSAGYFAPRPEERSRPGTAYLQRQLAARRRIAQIEERLRPLRDLSQRSRTAELPRSDLAYAAAYLVSRSRIECFVQLAGELGGQLDDLELECTGPWPPYSFVDGEIA
jgi:hypothetical protein